MYPLNLFPESVHCILLSLCKLMDVLLQCFLLFLVSAIVLAVCFVAHIPFVGIDEIWS